MIQRIKRHLYEVHKLNSLFSFLSTISHFIVVLWSAGSFSTNPFIMVNVLFHLAIIYADLFSFAFSSINSLIPLLSMPVWRVIVTTFANEYYLELWFCCCFCNDSNCSQIKIWIGQFHGAGILRRATIMNIAVSFLLVGSWTEHFVVDVLCFFFSFLWIPSEIHYLLAFFCDIAMCFFVLSS